MVKIKDLTDKQLLTQMEKYEKIYSQLVAERDKRVVAGANPAALRTVAEKTAEKIKVKELQEAEVKNKGSEAFHLSIDDRELSTYSDEDHSVSGEEEEEVRVTQLLKLNKDQLNELRMSGKNKKS